ncbi:MAG: hypothetical protein JO080_04875 [Mucilaginibacter sp.]|nr:hypothetical protein [Mucilaginibacter sp.]
MPTTKNPENPKENENVRRMGGSTPSSSPGNASRSKSNERGNQNRQQGNNPPSKSHR